MNTANLNQSIRLKELGWKQRGSYRYDEDGSRYSNDTHRVLEDWEVIAPTTDEMLEVLVKNSKGYLEFNLATKGLTHQWMWGLDFGRWSYLGAGSTSAEALADLLIKLIEAKEITL